MRLLPLLLALISSCSCRATIRTTPPPPAPVEVSADLRDLEAILRETRPARLPVSVQYEPEIGDCLGLTMRTGGGLTILIDSDLDYQAKLDVLIHEWAHAFVWDVNQRSAHGDFWGVAYAYCYRAVHPEDATGDEHCGGRR